MNLIGAFRPKPTLSPAEVQRGLRMMLLEGAASLGFWSITTSGFLAAFALALGANNFQIGILAAIPFVLQNFQIPGILLVERVRLRKLIATSSWFVGQALWLPIAFIPFWLPTPGSTAVSVLLGVMVIRGALGATCNAAWNGWIRDLIPPAILGSFYSRRMAWGTAVAVVFSLGTSFFIDYWRGAAPAHLEIYGFTIALVVGALTLGLGSPLFMAFMPEPRMQALAGEQPSLLGALASPFRNANYRRLLNFLFLWGAASNLAIPFFAVYMLQTLGMPLPQVIFMGVVSQLTNLLFLKLWGNMFDRFGAKAILSLSSSLYLVVIFGWIFTTMPDVYALTLPLLVVLHIFAGIAAAGVNLAVATIGLKVAPQGEATSYLATASIATNLGSGLGPLLGGLMVDFFNVRGLSFSFTWFDPERVVTFPALDLGGFDFLFLIAVVAGGLTLRILKGLREEGEVSEQAVLDELRNLTRQNFRAVSTAPGLGFLNRFPLVSVRRAPGVDVMLGLTAYQVAAIMRGLVTAATEGGERAATVAELVRQGVSRLAEGASETGEHAVDLARQAARGALHAVDAVAEDVGELTQEAMRGVTLAFNDLPESQWDWDEVMSAAAFGAVQGAGEAGADVTTAGTQAVAAARELAPQVGIPTEQAAEQAAQGALAAATVVAEAEDVAKLRAALVDEGLLMGAGAVSGPADSGD